MNQQETNKVLLLLAAQGDLKKASEIADYLGVADWQKLPADKSLFTPTRPYPAGGIVKDATELYAPLGVSFKGVGEKLMRLMLPDGIYLVFGDKAHKLYEPGKITDEDKARCTGIAVKMGNKSLVVDLYNMADGEEITLTNREDKTGWDGYKDNALDAGADWDGEGNTKHLLNVGLNPKIVLDRGQFIPSVAQWRFICLFRKELNQALAEVGGDELTGWYWTSTGYSATNAWGLYLGDGNMYFYAKASARSRVRAVSAFII